MTKKEALDYFKAHILPHVYKAFGVKDKVARAEAWNNYTDGLCKDRTITQRQYDTCSNPF